MIWRTLGRLILVPIAAALAAAASLAVLVTLGLERFTHATHGLPADADSAAMIVDWVLGGLSWLPGVTVLPALAVVIVGEVARIRSWLFYMLGGGAALASIPLLTALSGNPAATLPAAVFWQVLATAGFAGGFVYWLIAGRTA